MLFNIMRSQKVNIRNVTVNVVYKSLTGLTDPQVWRYKSLHLLTEGWPG